MIHCLDNKLWHLILADIDIYKFQCQAYGLASYNLGGSLLTHTPQFMPYCGGTAMIVSKYISIYTLTFMLRSHIGAAELG